MSYASFRQNNDINTLKDKFSKLNGKPSSDNTFDETYWTPKHVAGPEGTGEAILRFLPAPPDGNGGQEPDSIVKFFQFSINKNGKFYANRGRNTLGRDEADPANDYNMSIWARKDLTKDEKKKLLVNRSDYYIANIYVVKDPNKPENEGKVFRWQFGRQIYNLINEKLFPEFETDDPVNVFDPEVGADFVLRIVPKTIPDSRTGELRQVPTYDKSKFKDPSKRWSLEQFDAIWEQQHSLQSEIAEDKFKPYDELKKQFDRVMGIKDETPVSEEPARREQPQRSKPDRVPAASSNDDDLPWDTDDSPKSFKEEIDDEIPFETSTSTSTSNDDDDADSWFKDLG